LLKLRLLWKRTEEIALQLVVTIFCQNPSDTKFFWKLWQNI
jgi:hypothetical protein